MHCNNSDPTSCEDIDSVGISVMALSLGIILALSVTLNGIVCLVFYKKSHLLSVSNSFVLNLSCCELALSILVLPFTLTSVFSTDWIFNDTWCKIQGYLFTVCQIGIQLSLMVISVDRYYAIINSLRYPYVFTQRLGHILIACVWVISLILALPPLAGFGQYYYNSNEYTCSLNISASMSYLVFLSTLAYLLPLLVQSWCYMSIFRAAIGHTKRRSKVYPSMPSTTTRDPPSDSSDNSEITYSVQVHYRNMECKAVRTILMIALAYAICWVPYFVCSLSSFTEKIVSAHLDSAAVCFVFLSGIVNPVIYAFMNRITRHEINKFFCDAVSKVSGKTTTLNDSDEFYSTTTTTNFSTKYSGSYSNYRHRTGSKATPSCIKGKEMKTIHEESETDDCSKTTKTQVTSLNAENNSNDSALPVKEIVLEPATLYIHQTEEKKSVIKLLPVNVEKGRGSNSKWKVVEEINKLNPCASHKIGAARRHRLHRAKSESYSRDYGSFLYFSGRKINNKKRMWEKLKRKSRLSLNTAESNAISKHIPCLQSIHENELDAKDAYRPHTCDLCSDCKIEDLDQSDDQEMGLADFSRNGYHKGLFNQGIEYENTVKELDNESESGIFDETDISERNCFSV